MVKWIWLLFFEGRGRQADIDSLFRWGYPIVNGSCLHLGREHSGEFHLQREKLCLLQPAAMAWRGRVRDSSQR